MGLFFPAFGVEQAHFSHLTTCLTTCGDFWLIFDSFKAIIAIGDCRLFFVYCSQIFGVRKYIFKALTNSDF